MPWSGATFRKKHNKKLSPSQASKAAKQANAMLRSGASEGVAIATANKHAGAMRNKKAAPSDRPKGKRWI